MSSQARKIKREKELRRESRENAQSAVDARAQADKAIRSATEKSQRLAELEEMAVEYDVLLKRVPELEQDLIDSHITVKQLRVELEQTIRINIGSTAAKDQAIEQLDRIKVDLIKAEKDASTKELKKARRRLQDKTEELANAHTEISKLKTAQREF
jgi:hypothetical protein